MDSIILFFSVFIFLFSIILSFLINYIVIKINSKNGYGNIERKYLYFHNNKKNVPILGGISIILTIIISFVIYTNVFSFDNVVFVSIISLSLFGLVGLIDDLLKIIKKIVMD